MRKRIYEIIWSVTLIGALGVGCKKSPPEAQPAAGPKQTNASAAASPSRNPIARVHWSGKKRIGTETNAAYFMGIWNLPESARLQAQTLDKLSTAPWRLSGQAPPSHQAAVTNQGSAIVTASAQLRALLDDVVEEECYFELHGTTNKVSEATFAIRLNDARARLWRTNLAAVIQSLTGVQPAQSAAGWTVKQPEPASTIELIRAGEWVLVGVAPAGTAPLKDFPARIQREQESRARSATNFWLETQLDLARMTGLFPVLTAAKELPQVHLTVTGGGERVHSRTRLSFSNDLPIELEAWTVPTNLVRDPLISFTAFRGIKSWLSSLPAWNKLSLGTPPSQLFCWGLDGGPLQTYFAAAVPDATNRSSQLADLVVQRVNPKLDTTSMGGFAKSPTNTLIWTGTPLMEPYLQPYQIDTNEFVTGGLMRLMRTNAPPAPAEMLQQLQRQTNLIWYEWELSEARMRDWLYLGQLIRILTAKPQLPPESAGMAWLRATSSKLGNCASSLTRTDSRELLFSRQSSAGFSAMELHLIADWLESPDFPQGLHSTRASHPQPARAKQAATNSVPAVTNPPPAPP